MMNKRFSRVVSIIITILFVLNVFPKNIAFADQEEQTEQPAIQEEEKAGTYLEQAQKENKPIQILEECDEYSTIFQNPDGTKTAYAFGAPVRYKDKDGKLIDIDNQIIEASDEKQLEGYKYKNKSSNVDVYLPENTISNTPITVEYDKYKIASMPIIDNDLKNDIYSKLSSEIELSKSEIAALFPDYSGQVQKETINNIKNAVEFSNETEKEQALANGTATEIDSSIKYKSGFSDKIDIEYKPTGNGVKEDIILNEYTGTNSFKFKLTLQNLTATLRDDNEIVFTDGENVMGSTPAPYMYDSFDGEILEEDGKHISEKVTYSLEETEIKGEYILTVTADKGFLEDKSTVYPVIIDPSYYIMQNSSQVDDSFITSRYQNNNYGTDTRLRVGWSGDFYTSRAYIKMTSLPSVQGGVIIYASYNAYEDYGYSTPVYYDVHEVTSDWTESGIKWSNQAWFYGGMLSSQLVAGNEWYSWDITTMARNWYVDPYSPNYGIVLKYRDDLSGTYRYRRFISSNDGGDCKAYFSVRYTPAPTLSELYPSYDGEGRGYIHMATDMGAQAYRVFNYGTYLYTSTTQSWDIPNLTPGDYELKFYGLYGYYQYGCYHEMISDYSPTYYVTVADTIGPNTPEPPTVNLTDGDINSGNDGIDDASVSLQFDNVLDRPADWRNAAYFDVYQTKYGESEQLVFDNVAPSTLPPLNNLADNTTYSYRIKAFDADGNASEFSTYNYCTTADRTAPIGTFSISPLESEWTKNNPTISWSEVTDEGDGTITIRYKIDSNSGDWSSAPVLGGGTSGQGVVDCGSLTDGTHTIYVRAYDTTNTQGNWREYELTYNKDSEGPITGFAFDPVIEDGDTIYGDVNGIFNIAASASDLHGIATWSIDYSNDSAHDDNSFSLTGHHIADGTGTLESTNLQDFNLNGLEEDRNYTLRLKVTDTAGNIEQKYLLLHYAKDTLDVAPHLSITLKDGEETIDTNEDITVDSVKVDYSVLFEYAPLDNLLAMFFANDEQKGAQIIDTDELTFNPLEYDVINSKLVYPEGSQVFFRVMGEDLNYYRHYSDLTYEGHKISDEFNDATDLENLANVIHNVTKIELAPNNTTGSFQSTQKTINGRVRSVVLSVDETKPGNSSIEYYLVYGSGENDLIEIQPNATTLVDKPMNSFYLKAVMETDNVEFRPSIESWHLSLNSVAFGSSTVINNSFVDNARGFCNLLNVVHDETGNGSIKLTGNTYPVQVYALEGSVQSTVRLTPGKVWEVFLAVEEDKPVNTDIAYYISTDGGDTWSGEGALIPGTNPNDGSQWQLIKDLGENMENGTEIVLKAVLTGNGSNTPILNSWSLQCRQTMAGEAHDIKLIDEPDKLSTLVDANYMTLLRWEPSQTPGVTYNIYRSMSPYIDITNETPFKENITECSWSDYNLTFDTTFYYRVAAVKEYTIGGNVYERISLPSNEASAHTVEEYELNKKLGLQDYWSYSGFNTSNGTGYINVANGNMVYKSTDLVVPGPFFGAVMSRTYNQLAGTKTPMGYGWDYSFNTCLLKELASDGVTVVGLILKDGDGTLHKFPLVDGVFQSANGSFMKLDDTDPNEYKIITKDYVTYHFDKETMKLSAFTDNNGKMLQFRYDYDIDDGDDGLPDTTDRGNLKEVINDAGEKLTLEYNVVGAQIEDPDYVYVNDHIDMLYTVTWTQDTETTPKIIVYTYHYNENDQLDLITSTIEGEDSVVETFDYDVDLNENQIEDDYNMVMTDAEGRDTVVEFDSTYKTVVNVYEAVETLSQYSLADKYTFNYYDLNSDLSWDKTTVTDSYGALRSYEYDGAGLLNKKTDASGFSIDYHFNENNYLLEWMSYENKYNNAANPTTIRNYYTYNAEGNITQIKAEKKEYGESEFSALGPQTDFTYHETYTNKVVEMVVKKDGNDTVTTTYAYTTNGNLQSTTVADGSVDANNRPIEKTTTYEYYSGTEDPYSGMEWQLKRVTEQFGKQTWYFYDEKGRIDSVEECDADGQYVRTTAKYVYDDYGRTDTVSQPYNKNETTTPAVTNMDYNKSGRLIRSVNPDNTAEEWEYDLTGRLEKHYTGIMGVNGFNPNNTEEYVYDTIGRLISTTILNGTDDDVTNSISYEHWDSTSVISGLDADMLIKTDGEGYQTVEYYDISGRLIETKLKNGIEYLTTAKYYYDDIGNMIKSEDGAERTSMAYYNKLNQLVKTIVDPFNSSDGLDNKNYETQYSYDYLGNTLSQTVVAYESEANQTATNYVTNYQYDDLSRLEKVYEANPNYGQFGEPQYLETTYHYDYEVTVDGKDLIKNYTVDPNGYISETYFDELGRKTIDYNKADDTDGNDVDGEYMKTTYGYNDDDGRFLIDTVTRTDGTSEVYDYDVMGRVISINYFEESAQSSTESVTYTYNELGQIKTQNITNGSVGHDTSYIYDKMGRTLSIWEGTFNLDGSPNKVSDGLDVEYQYNRSSQLKNINYNTTAAIGEHNLTYKYDGYGRIDKIQLDPTELDANTVREYIYDNVTGELDYTKDYRGFSEDLADYIKKDLTYNSAGQVTELTYSDFDFIDVNNPSGVTEKYTVQFDGRGYIKHEQIDTDYSTESSMATVYKAYQYDSIGRLTKAVSGNEDLTGFEGWDKMNAYTYDRLGNRKSMDDGTNEFTYDYTQFNQLEEVEVYNDQTQNYDLIESYTYDLRGNQSVKYSDYYVGGSATKAEVYNYDLRNSMTSVETTEDVTGLTNRTTINSNVYNVDGQRIKKTEGNNITKYFYSGSALLYTQDTSGALDTENILDLSGSIIASKRFDDDANPNTPCEWENKYFFYNYDMRGSTTAIIKPEGEAVTQYAYDEYGNLSQTGEAAFKNEVTFTSSISDTSTGLQYMNSRFYDSSTGRFISQDTYTGNPYDPWTQNLYSYCSGNPTNFIDPTGHSAVYTFENVRQDNAGYYIAYSNAAKGDYRVIPMVDAGDFEGISFLDANGKPKKVPWLNRKDIWKLQKNPIKANSHVPNIIKEIDKAINETPVDGPKYNLSALEFDKEELNSHCFDYVTNKTGWNVPNNISSLDGLRASLVDALGEEYTVSNLLTAEQAESWNLGRGQTMIAMMYNSDKDYHFMKKDYGSTWMHKYGYSNVMEFKGDPWDYNKIEGEYYFFGWQTTDRFFQKSNIGYVVIS